DDRFDLFHLADLKFYQDWDSGYSKQQATRPQTLGYGLVDSPVGQLAWILEKFYQWTDCDGHPENVISRDRLLDNVMVYWLNASAASSARLYWESFGRQRLDPVLVPSAISMFPKEILRTSDRWARKRYTDLRYFGRRKTGGHFAAKEQPAAFVEEVRAGFAAIKGR
ncbi:MAG: epoxide hydrolase, partial [Pseudomonadota bacterium]